MHDRDESGAVLSSRATRIALLVIVPLTLVFGVQAISWAVPKVWTSGETLTAGDLNRNFAALDEAVTALSQPKSWAVCGSLKDLRNGAVPCEINGFPIDQFEYGFKINGVEVHVAECLYWNVGLRIANRDPYMVLSDNPTDGTMRLGGVIFYTGTNATDDDVPACVADAWRHRYWKIVDGNVTLDQSIGCLNHSLYCRRR